MATIGNSTQPASTTGSSPGLIALQRVQSTTTQNLVSIQGWSNCGNANWAEQIYCVYEDSAGNPGALLAQSAAFFTTPDFSMASRSADLLSVLALGSEFIWIGSQIEHDSTYLAVESATGYSSYTYYGGTFGTLPSSLSGLGSVSTDSRFGFSGTTEIASSVTIDSTPADIRVTESRTFRVTVPTTALNTGNVSAYVDAGTNDPITPSSVTNVSGLTYDVVITVPDTYAGLPYDETGYPVIISTPDGDATSAAIPYLPVTGNDYVVLTAAPGDFGTSLGTLATPDIIEWETNSGEITVNADATITSTNPNTTFEARAWDATDSTYGEWALQTLGTGGGGGGSGGITISGLSYSGISEAGITTAGLSI